MSHFQNYSNLEPNKEKIIKNFNWQEYLIANLDLLDAGINTEAFATKHYIDVGFKEKRKLKSTVFEWSQYIAINSDLIESGIITKEKAYQHYISDGYREERRIYIADFDWNFYITYNNHLMHTGINTQTKSIKHWNDYGKKEGLITSIKPLEEKYNKIINFDYNDVFDLYRNVYNVTLYNPSTINDSYLHENQLHYIENRNNPYFRSLKKENNIYDKLIDYNNMVLIIDFPCFGGGCSFFLNTILSRYKNETTFLIVRNFNNKIYFYLNDEIIFEPYVDEHVAINLLQRLKNKMQKVFFNSIVEHSISFVNSILDLNLDSTILTHDYSLFFKKPQMHYYEITDEAVDYKLNIHRFNRVISQHIGNLHTFGKYMNDYNNINISALPDYRNNDKKIINSNNDKFVIGILGDISAEKGYFALHELQKKIQNKNNIEIVVFGKVHIKEIKKQFSYHTINDLNKLLETHKPNILLELSLWPESFSFTLTLAMITKLPIFYQNKFYPCTVQRRLSLYHNAHCFDNVKDLSLKYLYSKSQNYFFTIKPTIYYPPFWEYYFTSNNIKPATHVLNQNYNVVIVTSKIYTSSKPFSYAPNRSIYSKDERFNQVIITLETIRKYIPDSFILLYDNSVFNDNEYQTLNSITDCFINHHNDDIVNDLTNNCIHKLYGEISQTFKMLDYLIKHYKNMNIKNLFKITGRYKINDTFNYKQYDNDEEIIFKRNKDVMDRAYYFTCFYKIGGKKIEYFYEIMEELFADIQNEAYDYEDYEVILPMLLYKNFKCVEHLGVTQDIAVWKDQSKI